MGLSRHAVNSAGNARAQDNLLPLKGFLEMYQDGEPAARADAARRRPAGRDWRRPRSDLGGAVATVSP